MNKDYNNPAFKKLLQKLQEESWQLELLISGFAIFGLFSVYEPLDIARLEARSLDDDYMFIVYIVAQISCIILIINLLLHVLLRGLWIGALGLRYVSGDIDYDYLNYSPKFTRYLKKKVGSFDRYIAQLENYCSIIFAVAFLLIFYVLAITFVIASIPFIMEVLVTNDDLPDWLGKGVGIPLLIFVLIGVFLTIIDFITQGFLKKKQWISKIYFPFYWIFSFVTLSFLYRPIIYNFLDNKFGKKLSFLLLPLGIALIYFSSVKFNTSNYFDIYERSNEYTANNSNYEDLLGDKIDYIYDVAIQSKTITDPFIKIFVLHTETIENAVFKINEGLVPEDDIRGYTSTIKFSQEFIDKKEQDSLRHEFISTFKDIYKIKIDSTHYDSEFIVGRSFTGKMGFETYISTKGLAEGKHVLKFYLDADKDGKPDNFTTKTIPFWYFED